ncbi:DNA polymerase-3 subunit gamma/tau [Ectothiorhodosinus mongolicus]|uniref:DNA polymerase III subunit gamma/tau n=1 Tax=Ectothiorhodosinus mongolicus TaxID=233100 RepID=A0A1R3VS02_9GAMM|nr:DNA polymerase III subunit gamma/tau [Ectothiorhodosinus mongolicus]ULX57875.1 DNA polymerase III subunit gamma/tau [Ectothiorhodosinus mongolicus]SIT65912.1 DNA polymerase-3 subunit gamma/tau [Ectothiorhodosinus mongolicus]
MSYQVLARKWRPRNFEALVGQPHVVRALVNALKDDRLHHAYLFTGTRGVGKTTIARVLAKCLNCETGITATPCGVCSACQEIDSGRFVDLIEVDAASRTGVDDTRELLENVPYAPTRGRFKIYLIDEVHMLSTHSFNALLKTLEEPPPHVKFLLATTDRQKLPVTILSRCLQFNLKAMPTDLIAQHLAYVLEQESIACEPEALGQLARAAHGSMRDALSLLDQAIGFGGGSVAADTVNDMLGGISRAHLGGLLRAVADADARAMLAVVAELDTQAPDYASVLTDLTTLLHQVALVQQVPEVAESLSEDTELLQDLAGQLSPEHVQLYYQIAIHGRRDFVWAPDPRSGLEMLLLRMLAFDRRAAVTASSAAAAALSPAQAASPSPSAPPRSKSGASAETASVATQASPTANAVAPPADADWSAVVAELGLAGMAAQLAQNCALLERSETQWVLGLAPQHESLKTPNAVQRLEAAVKKAYGEELRVVIKLGEAEVVTPAVLQQQASDAKQQEAEAAIAADPMTQALGEAFGAEVIPGSIRPVDESPAEH